MSAVFAIGSAIVAAALVLYSLARFVSRRDFYLGLGGFAGVFLVSGLLGRSGVLSSFSQIPPPFALFLVAVILFGLSVIVSPWGGRVIDAVPLRVLIALQGFRIMPEILLDLSFREGLAPVQMTWHGRNFDICSALLGLVLAAIWPKLAKGETWAWIYSFIGLGLLFNIVSIAILSSPVPFRVFMNEPANTFVTQFPYIWLPAVHVLIALVLHGLTFRLLSRQRRQVLGR